MQTELSSFYYLLDRINFSHHDPAFVQDARHRVFVSPRLSEREGHFDALVTISPSDPQEAPPSEQPLAAILQSGDAIFQTTTNTRGQAWLRALPFGQYGFCSEALALPFLVESEAGTAPAPQSTRLAAAPSLVSVGFLRAIQSTRLAGAIDPLEQVIPLKELLSEWRDIVSPDPGLKATGAYFEKLIAGRWFRACSNLAREEDGYIPDNAEVEVLWNEVSQFISNEGGVWEGSPNLAGHALAMLKCAEIVSKTSLHEELTEQLKAIKAENEPLRLFEELASRMRSDTPPGDPNCANRIQVPIVFVAAGQGISGTLRLDLMREGTGKIYPAPEMYLVTLDDDFRNSLKLAECFLMNRGVWDNVYDIRWKVEVGFPISALQGGSLGAALAVGMARLMADSHHPADQSAFEEKLPIPAILERTCFSGMVNAPGDELARVEYNGVLAKVTAALNDPRIGVLIFPRSATTEVNNSFEGFRSPSCPEIFTIPKDSGRGSGPTLTVLCMGGLEEAFSRLKSEQEMPREVDWTRGHRGELVPRAWLEEEIEACSRRLDETNGNGIILIVGRAGTGKTGFVRDLASRNTSEGNVPIVLFITRMTLNPEEFFGSLTAALRRKHQMPRITPEDQHLHALPRAVCVAQEFLLILVQLSERKIKETIWLDGLDVTYGDRARYGSESGALRELLIAMESLGLERLPRGIRIVATTRPPGSHNHLLHLIDPGEANLIDLHDEKYQKHIKRDLQTFFGRRFPSMAEAEIESTIQIVFRDRPFLHATLWAESLRWQGGTGVCGTLDQLLTSDILRTSRLWRDQEPGLSQQETESQVFDTLGLLACARQPLSVRTLGILFGPERAGKIGEIAKHAAKSGLVAASSEEMDDGTPLAFFHDYIGEFIMKEATRFPRQPRSVAAGSSNGNLEIDWHGQFAEACRQWKQMAVTEAREYSLRFLLSHLRLAEDWEALKKTVTDLDFLQAKLKADPNGIFDFIRLLHKALEGVPQLPPDHESRPLLNDMLEALKPHADLVSKAPFLALQQIHNDLRQKHGSEIWFGSLCRILEKIEKEGSFWLKTEGTVAGPRPVKLDRHRNVVQDVAFTQIDDSGCCLVATGGADQTIHVWKMDPALEYLYPIRLVDIHGREPSDSARRKITQDYPVTGLAFFDGADVFPEGKILVCSSGHGLSIYGISLRNLEKAPRKIARFGFKDLPQRMAVAKSKQFPFLVVGQRDGRARVFDVYQQCEIALLGEGLPDSGQKSHRQGVSFCCVAISPDGSLVAVGSPDDDYIRVWKLCTEGYRKKSKGIEFKLLYELPPPAKRQVDALAFSPDGSMLAAGGGFRHGQVEIWYLKKLTCVRFPAHKDAIWSLAFAPDPYESGELLLFTGSYDRSVAAWSCKTIAAMSRMDVVNVKIRELSGYFASREMPFKLLDFEVQPQPRAMIGHPDTVLSLEVSPCGGHLGVCGTDYSTSLWDLKSILAAPHQHMILRSPSDGDTLHAATILPGGKEYATAGNFGGVRIRNGETGAIRLSMASGSLPVRTVKSSADGRLLAFGNDLGVGLYDLLAEAEIQQSSIPGPIYSVAFSSDLKMPQLAAGDGTGNVFVMKNLSGESAVHCPGCHSGKVRGLAFSPDNSWLVSVGDDSKVVLIDLTDEHPPAQVASGDPHLGRIKSVAVSPCGMFIATGGHNTIKIRRKGEGPGDWVLQHNLVGHRHEIWSLSFSSNGRLLASGGHDSTARIWDVKTGKQLACLPCWNNVFAVSFAENDRVLQVVEAGQTGSVPTFWNLEIRGNLD